MPGDSERGRTSLTDLAPKLDFESGRPQPTPGPHESRRSSTPLSPPVVVTETRDERRERKRAAARGIEQFREYIGDPAPLAMTPQAVFHWTRDDQAHALAAARETEPDTGFMMRLLALCTLPRTNPGNRPVYRRFNGPFSLYLIAGGDSKLPYGTLPRLLLAWVCTEAARTQSPRLVLGASLSEFMRKLDLNASAGGVRGDRTRLQNQMERLFRCSVELTCKTDQGVHRVADLITNEMTLWWNPRQPDEPVLWESTIELGAKFFNEIIASPVPLDMNVLKAMKRSPLGLDLYLWLTYRLFGLTHPLSLTWRQLYRQFGSNPTRADTRTVNNFRADALRELEKLQDAWPDLDYSTPKGCLRLRPTRPLIDPIRPGAATRRPGDTDHAALRRHVFRVLAERPELREPEHTDELAETVKTAAARAGIPYDADAVTAAINAGRALAQTSDR